MTYVSARDRLARLGPVFTRQEAAAQFGWSAVTASVFLARWHRSKLIRAFGPPGSRYGIWINESEWGHLGARALTLAAASVAWPGAVMIGEVPLNEAGWTTRIPIRADLAILDDGRSFPPPAPDLILPHRRTRVWFRAIADEIHVRDGLPWLTPKAALVDMLLLRDPIPPDPDDLDLPATRSLDSLLTRIARTLGMDRPALIEHLPAHSPC